MRAAGGLQTVERKVYFYRLIVGTSLPRPTFDHPRAAQLIDQLSFIDGQRNLEIENGNALCIWPSQATGNVKLRMGIIRRSALPDIEEADNITPLSILEGQ